MPVSTYTEQRLLDQVFSLPAATVNAAIAAGATGVVSITCTALGEALAAGETILVSWGTGNVEAFVVGTGGAAAGATSIPVTSQTSSKAHAIGDLVVRQARLVAPANAYVGLLVQAGTLNAALTAGTAYTSLTVTALTQAVNNGDVLLLGTNGEYVIATANAAAGATTVAIQSFVPKANYAVGTPLVDVTTLQEASGGAYARVAYASTLGNWPAASGNTPATKRNANVITFPASTASWSANPLAGYAVWDASSGGNLLWFGYLTTPQTVNAAGITPTFAVNQLTTTLA